jgi:flagellar hook-associated protein 3 FlgL
MRISTNQINQQGINSLLDIARQVADTQKQISSGRRVVTPGDDPVGAARIIKLKQEIELRAQYTSNIDYAESQLSREESVLDHAVDVMQRIRELTLQASNGIPSADDRAFIAAEVSARYDELLSLVNARGTTGEYMFSGYQSAEQPITVSGDRVTYHGDEGRRMVQVDSGRQVAVTDSARSIFMDVEARSPVFTVTPHPANDTLAGGTITRNAVTDREAVAAFYPDDLLVEFRPASESPEGVANFTVRRASDNRVVDGLQNVTYAPGISVDVAGMSFTIGGQPQVGDRFFVETTSKQDVLTTVSNVVDALHNLDPIAEPEAFQEMLADTLAGLDNAMGRVLEVQTDLGARLNVLDSARDLHADLELNAQEMLSDIRDLDITEAVSRLAFQSFVLEAAQQSFVRVSRLSLFNSL